MIVTASTPGLPPLPGLRGDDGSDLALDVFSHITTHPPSADLKAGYGNVHRLCQLGGHTFRFAAAQFYFFHQPGLRENELAMKIRDATEGFSIHQFLDAYHLKPKLRVPQEVRAQDIWADTGEMERYFYTYVGATVYCNGSTAVVSWAQTLFGLAEGIKPEDEDTTMAPPPGYPAPPVPTGPPPLHGPPPPQYPSGPSGDASANAAGSNFTNLLTLSLIHETATRNKAHIEYTQTPVGPAHTPVWTVRCIVNGTERGSATSSKIKTAKEEAARKAFVAMGWHPGRN